MREDEHSIRLKRRSMTVGFRPVEANELVDDERATQRLYMGSAITMEQGKLARISSCVQMQLPAACASHVCHEPPTPKSSARSFSCRPRIYCLHLPVVDCRSLTASWSTSMLETALFRFLDWLSPYYSTNKTPTSVRSVTLGMRLSFHVHHHGCIRAACTLHGPAAPFSLCI